MFWRKLLGRLGGETDFPEPLATLPWALSRWRKYQGSGYPTSSPPGIERTNYHGTVVWDTPVGGFADGTFLTSLPGYIDYTLIIAAGTPEPMQYFSKGLYRISVRGAFPAFGQAEGVRLLFQSAGPNQEPLEVNDSSVSILGGGLAGQVPSIEFYIAFDTTWNLAIHTRGAWIDTDVGSLIFAVECLLPFDEPGQVQ